MRCPYLERVPCRELQTSSHGPVLPKPSDDPQGVRIPQRSRMLLEREVRQETAKINESLEEKLLHVAEKFENEKSDLTRDVSDLTSRLVEARLTIAELEEENEQYRNDCNIAVRLLQCKPSSFVAHKFNSGIHSRCIVFIQCELKKKDTLQLRKGVLSLLTFVQDHPTVIKNLRSIVNNCNTKFRHIGKDLVHHFCLYQRIIGLSKASCKISRQCIKSIQRVFSATPFSTLQTVVTQNSNILGRISSTISVVPKSYRI
ncbi:brain-enriched guanylate kinase-associated protein [Caerostris extrusa]|uniref:Brain-enriched guanylate kinase-associated protein n=1 Tax=Caerostris extrusa TaxID=172846 RepID=A0AAV4R7J2_CAEEX|nr:brain-enriched guanylate kinase-associated protein [Caerostris extrusa]